MKDEEALFAKAEQYGSRIADSAKKHENILIVSHHDADGLCSATIAAQFIFKNGGHCNLRIAPDPNDKSLEKIARGQYDLILFLDLGSVVPESASKYLGDKWLVIDHHSIPKEELVNADFSARILNPYQFGYDGSSELSCAGLVHFITRRLSSDFSAFLAIVGALSDGQDRGPDRSLVGLNAKIAAEAAPDLESRHDLLFQGKEVRPIHEAVANSVNCYIPGLTGNKDACLASLRSAGLELKQKTRWKTISDLTPEEKQALLDAIAPHLSGTTTSTDELSGTVYVSKIADEYSLAHDARDFASLLNSCGRMGKAGLALLLCFERAPELASECDGLFSSFRSELVRALQSLVSNADRWVERQQYSIVLGDGILNERMTGAVCQVLASLNRNKNKIIFLRTTTADGDVKVSARLGKGMEVDVGLLMGSIGKATGGVGGGLYTKVGAKFSISKQQEFQMAVDAQFQTLKIK